ncbi:AAA family ATPase [Rhizobium sp. P38BS-XIX]|uniref:AAA family ATPase n=1 Tax=Rhizobium sp. P38BS-XIX TaxID=2726740 RepID=UPI0014570273|nr:AAA family ATPase [Rhizobium sp. P38BS-XIX]NLS00209.1 AAA family ATPase [Rhizobium sp. P38BS-XIX]
MIKAKSTTPSWTFPTPAPDFLQRHSQDEIEQWRKLLTRVIDAANANGWTKAEVARRANIKDGTFSQWSNGNYPGVLGNISEQVGNWLEALEESASIAASIPVSPPFVKTYVGADVYNVLLFTQMTAGFTAVTLPSGSGKTTTARHFCDTRPHAWLATISPNTKTVHGMLVELAAELDIQEHNPTRLVRAIGRKLQRIGDGTLLVIDEAQNLVPDAVNQIRHFVDIHKCGVALLGNEDTAVSFIKDKGSVASRAQVATRFDRRLKRERDPVHDAAVLINAWKIDDDDCVKFLHNIATKPGALRNIDRTIKAAMMAALGNGEDLSLNYLVAAWRNRDMGDIA